MIRLSNLDRFYEAGPTRTYVLRRINLEIREGEFVTIMGQKLNPPAPTPVAAAPGGGGGGGGGGAVALSEDARSQIRRELVALREELRRAIPKAADR